MKREGVVAYFIGVVLVAISILAVYLFNLPITGFAVFDQKTQNDFNLGVYENVGYDENTSTIFLLENETYGIYTSAIFDANESAIWNNLTWSGTGNLIFEVRNCSNENCSDSSFASFDLDNLNLVGQYFQYRVFFDSNVSNDTLSLENVSIDYSFYEESEELPSEVVINILQPFGIKNSTGEIPIQFNLSGGENYTCWYNIRNTLNNSLVTQENVSLPGCNNTFFNLSTSGGNFTFTLLVNSSFGLGNKTSLFSIVIPGTELEEEEEAEVEEEEEEEEDTSESSSDSEDVSEDFQAIIRAGEIEDILVEKVGTSEKLNWRIENVGTVFLSCKFKSYGDYSSWIDHSESVNLLVDADYKFIFEVNVPEDVGPGNYVLKVGVECNGVNSAKEFNLIVQGEEIVEDVSTSGGELTSGRAEGEDSRDLAPVSGFAISERVGTGGSLFILVVFVLFLSLTFLTVRGYRQKKKNIISLAINKYKSLRNKTNIVSS